MSTVQPNAQRVCATVRSPSRDARWIGVLPSYNKTKLKSDVWLTVHRNSVWIRKTN